MVVAKYIFKSIQEARMERKRQRKRERYRKRQRDRDTKGREGEREREGYIHSGHHLRHSSLETCLQTLICSMAIFRGSDLAQILSD